MMTKHLRMVREGRGLLVEQRVGVAALVVGAVVV
jgi:hypothetical protein